MIREKGEYMGYNKNQSDFNLSNVELGLLENEVYNEEDKNQLKLLVFNKLEMILELNNKLYAN